MEDSQYQRENFARKSKKFQMLKKDVEKYTKGTEELKTLILSFFQQVGVIAWLNVLLYAVGASNSIPFKLCIVYISLVFLRCLRTVSYTHLILFRLQDLEEGLQIIH